MLAEDIAPTRLEKAKQIIAKIIDKLGSDRVGIIIYAGNSYPLLPITTDHAAANMFLNGLWKQKGVFPPELIGKKEACFDFIIEYELWANMNCG